MQESRVSPLSGFARESSFGNTDWFVVRCAGQVELPVADPARAQLCQDYWLPVFRYVRGHGHSVEDAQDLTQEFFARLLRKNSLLSADRKKGKFRSFLLVQLKRFLSDQWARAHCQKRGSGHQTVSLDSGDTEFRRRIEPVDELNPELLCERGWARLLIARALEELERECLFHKSEKSFKVLKSLVTGESELTYAATARKLHLTEANVKVKVHRMRQRLRELLESALKESGTPPMQIDAELHDLYTVLSQ